MVLFLKQVEKKREVSQMKSYVVTLGLQEEFFKLLKKSGDNYGFSVICVEDISELINYDLSIFIVNDTILTQPQREQLKEFFVQVDSQLTEHILLTQQEAYWEKNKNVLCVNSQEILLQKVETIMQKTNGKLKRAKETAQNIQHVFLVYSLLSNNSSLSTENLAKLAKISTGAAKRHIALLKLSGHNIEFNIKAKEWTIKKPEHGSETNNKV